MIDALKAKCEFRTVRQAIMEVHAYIPRLKFEPRWAQRGPLVLYRNTIFYSRPYRELPEAERKRLLWHYAGLHLYEHIEPETPEEEAAVLIADGTLDETKRIAGFLRALGLAPAVKADRPDAANVAT